MIEQDVMRKIMIVLSRFKNVRLFRNNTGTGWVGKIEKQNEHTITLSNYRMLHAGLCTGSSDIIGWTELEITPEMVGKKIAVFTAIEVKSKTGKPTKEQENFIQVVKNSGGYAGVARNENEATEIINL